MKIVSVGTAFPEHCYTQDEVIAALEEYWRKKYNNIDRLRSIQQNLLVGTRRFCLTIPELHQIKGLQQRSEQFIIHAVNLGEQAIKNALAQCGLHPSQVDHIFFTTITGVAVPSIDGRLMNRLAFRGDIKRSPLFGLGCLGGAAGLSRALDYVKAYPKQIAIVLSVELCSLTVQREDVSLANVVSSGLFGDGAAAAVIAGAEVELSGVQGVDSMSSFYNNTEEVMGWEIVNEGFKIVLSPDVPKMVKLHAKEDLTRLLTRNGLNSTNLSHYICHPGGPKVMEAIGETLEISREALRWSWQTLKDVGNLSSASVLLILKETLEKSNIQPGDYSILMAMGPGFCSEWILLRH